MASPLAWIYKYSYRQFTEVLDGTFEVGPSLTWTHLPELFPYPHLHAYAGVVSVLPESYMSAGALLDIPT